MTKLTQTMHLIEGHRPDLAALETPFWSGTLEDFWEANQEHLRWGDIQEIASGIRHGGAHRLGGGAEPAMTVLSDFGRQCLILHHKTRAVALVAALAVLLATASPALAIDQFQDWQFQQRWDQQIYQQQQQMQWEQQRQLQQQMLDQQRQLQQQQSRPPCRWVGQFGCR
jgi:hypothetical protein